MTSPSDQTLLITGATSYVGSHVIKLALDKGYHVRGIVRSESSIAGVLAKFAEYGSKLSLSIVADLTKPELYAAAFTGTPTPITGVINLASPFALKVENNKRDLLDPAIHTSLGVINAVHQHGGAAVRRLVNTSSFAAIVDLARGLRPGYVYTEADWNPATYEQAAAPDADGATAYCASKTLAERALWDWVAAHKPGFDLVAVNPPWVFGPHVGGVHDLAHLNESSHALYALLDAKEVPPPDFAGFVDVRDVAAAHIAAFERPEAGGQRFLVGVHFDYQSVVDAVREGIPELRDRLPVGNPGKIPETYGVDGGKAERVLGISYTPLDRSMRDSFAQFVEAERQAAAASA